MVQGLPKTIRVSYDLLVHDTICVSTEVNIAVLLLSPHQCMLDMSIIPLLLQCVNHPASQMQKGIFCCCSM